MKRKYIYTILLLLAISAGYAQNTPVSSLPTVDSLGQMDFFPLVQGGHYHKAYISQLPPRGRPKGVPYFSPHCRLITDTLFQRDSLTGNTTLAVPLNNRRTALFKMGNINDTAYGIGMILGYNPVIQSNVDAVVGVADMSLQGMDSFTVLAMAQANNNAGSQIILQRYAGMILDFADTNQVNGTQLFLQPATVAMGCQARNGSNNLIIDTNGLMWQYRNQYLYRFPNSQGMPGQAMVTDGAGNLSWQTPAGSATGWNLMGNGGTNPAIDFVGTTDSVFLMLRTGNLPRLCINPLGAVGIGTLSPQFSLDINGSYRDSVGNTISGVLPGAVIGMGYGNPLVCLTADTNQAQYTMGIGLFGTEENYGESVNKSGLSINYPSPHKDASMSVLRDSATGGLAFQAGYSYSGVQDEVLRIDSTGLTYNEDRNVLFSIGGNYVNIPGHLNITSSTPASGYVLTSDASGNATWQAPAGSGSPAGINTQIQYNTAGSLGADSFFTWNKSLKQFTVGESSPYGYQPILYADSSADSYGIGNSLTHDMIFVNGINNSSPDLISIQSTHTWFGMAGLGIAVNGYLAKNSFTNTLILGDQNISYTSFIIYDSTAAALPGKTAHYTFTQRDMSIGNVVYTWPSAQGAANTLLANDGSGNLSWQAGAAGTLPAYANNAAAVSALGTGKYYVTDGTDGTLAGGARGLVMQTY